MSMQTIRTSTEEILAPSPFTKDMGVIRERWVEKGTGSESTWVKYTLPDTTQVLGLTEEGKVITIREFQPGVGVDYLHVVGETVKEFEQPRQAAVRGLREETGYQAGNLFLLSAILENSSRSDRLIHLYLATDCRKVDEPENGITVELMTPADFWIALMNYFATCPAEKHGGGNTLKVTVLAFAKMGMLEMTKRVWK